jgi:Ca2+-binding EF-hand superfamily protein
LLFFIEDWYKCFHKDCPSGELTEDEFKKIYAQFFPAGDSSTFAGHVFKRFAVNGEKKISFAEFLTALSVTAKGNVETKLNWAFNLYDADGDGFISRGDMLEIVTVSDQNKP